MLSKIISEIIDPILETIQPNFIDRYGGLVQTLEVKEALDPQNPTKTQIQKFPISCYVDQDECNEPDATYKDLVPDETKASILYFEELNPMQFDSFTTGALGWQKWKGKVRLVVWLNAARLGIGEQNNNYACDWIFPFMDQLIKTLTISGKVLNGDFEGGIVTVQPANLAPKNLTIFSKYTYNKYINYHRYPYDYFAIDLDIIMQYCIGSNTTISLGNVIQCPFSQLQTPFSNEYSMYFDGVNQKINIKGVSELSFTDGLSDLPFTFSIWIKPISTGGNVNIIGKQGTGSLDPTEEFQVRISSAGKLEFYLFSGSGSNFMGISTTANITFGQWQLIQCTYDASMTETGMQLYINSAIQPVTRFFSGYSGITQYNNNVFVGGRYTAAFYRGYMDELRLYNRVLSSLELSNIYNLGTPDSNDDISGLIAYNRMGDGATYDGTDWMLPDRAGILPTAISLFMGSGNRTTDIP